MCLPAHWHLRCQIKPAVLPLKVEIGVKVAVVGLLGGVGHVVGVEKVAGGTKLDPLSNFCFMNFFRKSDPDSARRC